MPRIADLQITRRTADGRIVEYFQVKEACIRVDYDIAGKTFAITEVTAAEPIYFSAAGSPYVDYIARVGEHFFADMNREQTDRYYIDMTDAEMLA